MSYKKSTKRLGLPVIWWGDRLDPDSELKKYTIIENMLVAATHGMKTVVFDDGEYVVSRETDSTFAVTLMATGSHPSARGIIDGAYFDAPSEIKWSGLREGRDAYLYLQASPKTFEDPSSVTALSSEYPVKGKLIMARIDFRENEPELDTVPVGKVYSEDVAKHAGDSVNPHGDSLQQGELVVTGRLVLHGPKGPADVVVENDGKEVVIPASSFSRAVTELAGRTVEKVSFVSAGKSGIVLSVDSSKKVFSVFVQRKVTSGFEGSVGEIGVGYHGEDDEVDAPNEFAVYNGGDVGVPMLAIVICG